MAWKMTIFHFPKFLPFCTPSPPSASLTGVCALKHRWATFALLELRILDRPNRKQRRASLAAPASNDHILSPRQSEIPRLRRSFHSLIHTPHKTSMICKFDLPNYFDLKWSLHDKWFYQHNKMVKISLALQMPRFSDANCLSGFSSFE